jgi:hypothetical protein
VIKRVPVGFRLLTAHVLEEGELHLFDRFGGEQLDNVKLGGERLFLAVPRKLFAKSSCMSVMVVSSSMVAIAVPVDSKIALYLSSAFPKMIDLIYHSDILNHDIISEKGGAPWREKTRPATPFSDF